MFVPVSLSLGVWPPTCGRAISPVLVAEVVIGLKVPLGHPLAGRGVRGAKQRRNARAEHIRQPDKRFHGEIRSTFDRASIPNTDV